MIYLALLVFVLVLIVVALETMRILRMDSAEYRHYVDRQRKRNRFLSGIVEAPTGWFVASVAAVVSVLAAILASLVPSTASRVVAGVALVLWILVTALAVSATFIHRPKLFLHPQIRAANYARKR